MPEHFEADPRREHPDELMLVGWNEDRLLDFERDEVEKHLAQCRACREQVAALEPRVTASVRRFDWRPLLAAAAVVTFLVVLFLRERDAAELEPRLQVALAGTREATFSGVRGAPLNTGELYVGVRLEAPGWVRLIAVDADGGVHEVPLDPDGSSSARFAGESDHVFGPYPMELGDGAPIEAIVALSSRRRIDWSAIEESAWQGSLDGLDVVLFSQSLGANAIVQRLR